MFEGNVEMLSALLGHEVTQYALAMATGAVAIFYVWDLRTIRGFLNDTRSKAGDHRRLNVAVFTYIQSLGLVTINRDVFPVSFADRRREIVRRERNFALAALGLALLGHPVALAALMFNRLYSLIAVVFNKQLAPETAVDEADASVGGLEAELKALHMVLQSIGQTEGSDDSPPRGEKPNPTVH